MRLPTSAQLMAALALAACQAPPEDAPRFPAPDRPVSDLGSNQFSTEDQRDRRGEAQTVMDLAQISPGMTVADIGAGNGYYTVRLAERVGAEGRVLAQDIDQTALDRLGRRVERQRLDNVSIRRGELSDPMLPENSFDRIFMVHMYHEIGQPYEFLWRMWPALRDEGQVIVVDVDRPTDQHGIPPKLLFCEFDQVGFKLVEFVERPDFRGYFARFERSPGRAEPEEITACPNI